MSSIIGYTKAKLDSLFGGKADLTAGAVPDAQLPARLSDASLRAAFDAEVDAGDFTPTGAWDWTGATVTGLGGGTVTSTSITDSTATGRSVLTAADAAAARTAIGAQATGSYAALGGANVFTAAQRINGPFGINVDGSPRQPFSSTQTLDAVAAGTIDKVAHSMSTVVTGNLGAGTGSNPNFAWGLNVFTVTGTAAGDGAGGTIQNLIESDVAAPSGTISVVQGLVAQAAFFGASAGATVTQMESLRVAAPARKAGATAGTATNVYGLFVEKVLSSSLGSAGSVFSLYVDGGNSRFAGRVDVTNQIANAGTSDLQVYAGFADADGGALQLMKAAAGGHARVRLATASSQFQVFDGTTVNFAITNTGIPKWAVAGNAQTTVGAAGGASAPPATPTKYLKVQDSTGTTYVIAAYAPA